MVKPDDRATVGDILVAMGKDRVVAKIWLNIFKRSEKFVNRYKILDSRY